MIFRLNFISKLKVSFSIISFLFFTSLEKSYAEVHEFQDIVCTTASGSAFPLLNDYPPTDGKIKILRQITMPSDLSSKYDVTYILQTPFGDFNSKDQEKGVSFQEIMDPSGKSMLYVSVAKLNPEMIASASRTGYLDLSISWEQEGNSNGFIRYMEWDIPRKHWHENDDLNNIALYCQTTTTIDQFFYKFLNLPLSSLVSRSPAETQ